MEFKRGQTPMHSMGLGLAAVLFDKTTNKENKAYSYGLYYSDKEWMKIIQWLLNKKFTPFDVEMILRSKLMRYAADHSPEYRSVPESDEPWVTLKDFIHYNNDPKNSDPPYKSASMDFLMREVYKNPKTKKDWMEELGYNDLGQLNEDAMGGVSAPMATLNNTPGMGNAVPAGVNKVGSGDKWGSSIGKKPYTQAADKKKKKKKKLEEENINPYDKLGTAMAKKMGVRTPFKKKKAKGNQNSMTMKASEEFKIMPYEEFKKLYENKKLKS
jgi:hypothetical protein